MSTDNQQPTPGHVARSREGMLNAAGILLGAHRDPGGLAVVLGNLSHTELRDAVWSLTIGLRDCGLSEGNAAIVAAHLQREAAEPADD